ncbi:MAG: oxidoreductase [Acidobacteriota bacterium]|nr:oxidoreductase [Acidobacteriota bacterium]
MADWTVEAMADQAGRLAVVTGANSGIGWHTALELARAGAEVVLTARTEAKGRDAVERIRRELANASVRWELLDLASLRSIREFAARLSSTSSRLDLLVNNAGVMAVPRREVTEDGFEQQMGTNFLGHFALTGWLLPALRRGTRPRVTNVSSLAARMGLKRIRFEDMQWDRGYKPWDAYCQSKLANLLFTVELARRSEAGRWGVSTTAAHPGVACTNLQSSGPEKQNPVQKMVMELFAQDAAAGAWPTLCAATDPKAAMGSFYGPKHLWQVRGPAVEVGMPAAAGDVAAAERLWAVAEELTGMRWG